MIVDLNLVEAKILYGGEIVDCAISIDEGRIFKVGKITSLPKSVDTIDLKGKLVLPGLIDVHVHLRGMNLSYKEDFKSGTYAAAAGGFSTVLDMPNTSPLTNSPDRLREKIIEAEKQVIVNVGFYGIPLSNVDLISDMVKVGAIAFKVNLLEPMPELNIESDEVLLEVLNFCSKLDRVTSFHAESKEIVNAAKDEIRKLGDSSIDAFLKVHSPIAEVEALKRIIRIASKTEAKIHIAHISCRDSLIQVRQAKRRGLRITCEVTPHHLLLSETDLKRIGTIALTLPPLRPKEDMLYLWRGIHDGTIDIISSDHAPHLEDEKRGDVWECPPGIPGLETTLPLLLTRVRDGILSISEVIRCLAEKPAEIFGLKRKGKIYPGFDADLTVVDMHKKARIDSSEFYSKAKYSPFDGWIVTGIPVKTFVKGELVMDDGEILTPTYRRDLIIRRPY